MKVRLLNLDARVPPDCGRYHCARAVYVTDGNVLILIDVADRWGVVVDHTTMIMKLEDVRSDSFAIELQPCHCALDGHGVVDLEVR